MPASYFSGLFGSSPIKPLQEHMTLVLICAGELHGFLEAVFAGDWERAEALQQDIARKEDEADALKRKLRLHLPRSLFMPVSRRDLLEVLRMQDGIANKTRDIAGLILGRRMSFPESLHGELLAYADRSIDAARQAQAAINELDELLATGFRGNEVELVEQIIKKLDNIESDSDEMQVRVRASLFRLEKNLPPVDVMFMYKIIDWIGDLADKAQRVGSRLELMLAR